MVEVEHDDQEIIQRVAALDIGKSELVCCVRLPGPGRRRLQEVRTFSTMTRSLLAMSNWLTGLGVSRVVMEATGDYWKPPFYLLEGSFEGVSDGLCKEDSVDHLKEMDCDRDEGRHQSWAGRV